MENNTAVMIIVGVCVLVLLIGIIRKKAEVLVNFMLRAVVGTIAIYFVNLFLGYEQIGIAVGINPLTVLTSGTLGFPGLILLYGINVYKML